MSQCNDIYPLTCNTGICNNSLCICPSEFFTGRSDWVNAEFLNCQIFLPVIWFFWSLNLLEILICSIYGYPVLFRVMKHHHHVRQVQRKKGKRYSVRDNLGLLSALPFWLISLPTHTALAIFKLSKVDARLGLDVGLTVLWMLSRIFTDLSSSSSRAALTISTMQTAGASTEAIGKREMKITILFLLSFASTFSIWPVYASGGIDMNLAMGLFSAHFILVSFLSFFNASIAHQLAKEVYTSLTESHEKLKDDRILGVRDILVKTQNFERNTLAFVGICYLVLGSVPNLWTIHDYFWAILWLIWPILGLNSLLTLTAAQQTARGEKEKENHFIDLAMGLNDTGRLRTGSVTSTNKQLKDLASYSSKRLGFS